MSTSTTASSSPKADPESGDLIIHVTEQIHGHSGVELGGIGILESGDKDGKEEKLLKQNTQSAISPDGPYRRLGSDELSMALSKLSNNLELRLAANENSRSPAYKYGDPGAFGLGGFALTTFVLSVCNAGQLSSGVSEVVLPLAMWYGGFTQLFAGLWEVQTGFTFAATAYCSYGAFWLSYATFAKFVVPDFATALAAGTIDENDINHASGLFLLSWTFFTLFMTIAAWRVNRAVFLIFALLLPTFILLTAGAYANNSDATKAGGWIGILCAFSAWYVMAAKVINSTNKKVVLPLGEVD